MSFDPTAIPDLIGRFHPLFLHFPIGLLLWAGIVESIQAFRRQPIPAAGPVSLPVVIPGACFSVLACITGWLLANPEDPDSALAWHRWLGVATAVLALVTTSVGCAMVKGRSVPRHAYRLALFICVPVLAGGGHIGGEMKWGDGFVEKGFEKVFFSTAEADNRFQQGVLVSVDAPQEQQGLLLYHDLIRDTLDQHCVSCHGPEKVKGELRLDTPDDIKDLKRENPVIIPGDPDQSLLVELILLPADDEDRMPPPDSDVAALSEKQQRGIVEWVRAGAPWPAEGAKGLVGPSGIKGPSLLSDGHEEEADDPESSADTFNERVQPILKSYCYECHGPKKQKSGLRLDLAVAAMADREFPTIIPGNVEESELIVRIILPDDDEDRMPPEGDRLTEEDVTILKNWIESGAHWPESEPEPDLVSPVEGATAPITVSPGRLPDLPRISISSDLDRSSIDAAVELLNGVGVRVAPLSRIDDAHEAVFRLLRQQATDEKLAMLKGLEPVLSRLDLAGTAVTSASVTGLWRFRKLRQLNLSETVVTDDDVATLASLSELTVLNLFGTEVTDDCLSILQQIPSLKRVYLWRTAVTPAAARQLADARPDLLVDIGQPLPPSDSEGGEDVEAEDVDSVEESRAQEGEKEL